MLQMDIDYQPLYHKKKATFKTVYRICSLFIGISFLLVFASVLFTFGLKINDILDNTNDLVSKKIPSELNYLHQVIRNQTLLIQQIERSMKNDFDNFAPTLLGLDEIVRSYNKNFNTPQFKKEIKNIVDNLDIALGSGNFIQLEKDIHIIACSLNNSTNTNSTGC